mgnify:CR=1 FL=1
MDYAQKIIYELLTEEVQSNNVIDAIKKCHEVEFIYDNEDGDPRGKKERITVQPVCYGTTKKGNPCFRGYQTNGSSESAEKGEGKIPGWRLFLLNRVLDNTWKDSGKIFEEPPGYNREGDKTMDNVIFKADFKYSKSGLKKYNDKRHAQAVEKNPFFDFEKQLKKKNKKMAPDYVMKSIQATAKPKQEWEREWDMAMAEINKGNNSSIFDMSRQKDFGENQAQPTVGPQRKGEQQAPPNNSTAVDYSKALQNGPRYKGEKDHNEVEDNNTENNSDKNEYQQRNSESTENDA